MTSGGEAGEDAADRFVLSNDHFPDGFFKEMGGLLGVRSGGSHSFLLMELQSFSWAS